MTELNEFTCHKCDSNQLDYEKWIRCQQNVVVHDNGHIEYLYGEVDETDELGAEFGYVCRECGHPLTFRGCRIETEKDLIDYLSIIPEERLEQEQLYLATLEQQAQEQEQIEQAEIESFINAEKVEND